MDNLLEKLENSPSIGDSKLASQISFMETLNEVIKTPITISILESLKELRNIKRNQLERLKNKT